MHHGARIVLCSCAGNLGLQKTMDIPALHTPSKLTILNFTLLEYAGDTIVGCNASHADPAWPATKDGKVCEGVS